jgi:hypothetical protein
MKYASICDIGLWIPVLCHERLQTLGTWTEAVGSMQFHATSSSVTDAKFSSSHNLETQNMHAVCGSWKPWQLSRCTVLCIYLHLHVLADHCPSSSAMVQALFNLSGVSQTLGNFLLCCQSKPGCTSDCACAAFQAPQGLVTLQCSLRPFHAHGAVADMHGGDACLPLRMHRAQSKR